VATALQLMGCDAAQGWYFSRPLSAALASMWLAEHGVPGARRPGRVAAGPAPMMAGPAAAAAGPASADADWTIRIPRPASVPASSGPPRPASSAPLPDGVAPRPGSPAPLPDGVAPSQGMAAPR
jgi:hypothetical protein